MASKRDLQLIRLACRRRWLTPEQGEDCLVLKRKLGAKLSVEQILRQRGYMSEAEIDELAEAAGHAVRRRRPQRPEPPPPVPVPSETGRADPFRSRPSEPVKSSPPQPERGPDISPAPPSVVMPVPLVAPDDKPDVLAEPMLMRPLTPSSERTQFGDTIYGPLPGPQTIEGPPLDFAAASEVAIVADELPFAGPQTDSDAPPEANAEPTMYAPREDQTVLATLDELISMRATAPHRARGDDVTLIDLPLAELLKAQDQLPPVEPVPLDAPTEWLADAADAPELRALALSERLGAMTGLHPQVYPVDPASADPTVMPEASLTVAVDADAGASFDIDADDAMGPFGAYDVHYLVARGERSAVYRATHVETQRDVALKILLAPGRAAASFVSERGVDMVAAAQLEHPRIVRVLDVGHVLSRYYVALEYAAGWALDDKLATEDVIPLNEALSIVGDIATALSAAESRGVVHGDVRPNYVLVDDDGRARLTGFGFYSVVDGCRGTPGHMAPEVAAGALPTAASDQFSLGTVLFQLACGRPPYAAETEAEQLRLTREVEPPDPRFFRPDLPEPVAQLILRLMGWAPEERFPSFAYVVGAIDAARSAAEAAVGPSVTAPVATRTLGAKALVAALALMLGALGIPLVLDVAGWVSLRNGQLARPVALGAAFGLFLATAVHAVVALIRRGELPLPLSSAWLVRGQELAGILGATLLVAGFAVSPPALLNLSLAAAGVALLISVLFGVLLRGAIAQARGEDGFGRVLGVLGDGRLIRWRHWHVPGLTAVAAVASMRWMALAYFAAS